MKLIVGLGNPGHEYENTRHNVGFILIDYYLNNEKMKQEKEYLILRKKINDEDVIFLKPLTFMNLSGVAVKKVVNYYKINSKDILIIHDDLDMPVMNHRFKFSSSSGGHNGIKSIIENLGTKDFNHLKIGINNNKNIDTKDYVLSKLSKDEIEDLKTKKYKDMIDTFIKDGIDIAMNMYN